MTSALVGTAQLACVKTQNDAITTTVNNIVYTHINVKNTTVTIVNTH